MTCANACCADRVPKEFEMSTLVPLFVPSCNDTQKFMKYDLSAWAWGLQVTAMAGVALVLSGCVSTIGRQPEVAAIDVPRAWSIDSPSASSEPTVLDQWWLRFEDPLLASLIARSLNANTSIESAKSALRQARALRDVAAAGLLPAVGSSASVQHGTSGGHSTGNSFKLGLDASWELDFFGGNRSALYASEALTRASEATLGDVQRSIAAEVALAYITMRSAQARLSVATENLASQQDTLQITQWRLQAGLVSSLEAEQARAAAEQTSAQLPALQTSLEQTRHAIAVLTGQPPAALSPELAPTGPIPRATDGLALNIPAETLRRRPDVRAAEQQVMAALARVAQADAARYPSFKLNGSIGLNALTLGALTNGASIVSAVLAGVSWPVFDGGAAVAQVRAQQAAAEQSRFAYRAVVLTALKEVEDALIALRGDRERLLRLQSAAGAASDAALMARQRFASGLVDFQVVLETQRTQLSSQDAVAGANADLAADHVRLFKALGGGWLPNDVDSAVTLTDAPLSTRK